MAAKEIFSYNLNQQLKTYFKETTVCKKGGASGLIQIAVCNTLAKLTRLYHPWEQSALLSFLSFFSLLY